MTSRIKNGTIEVSMTRYFPWKIATNFSARKRSDLRWKVERDLIEVWMRSQTPENKSKISNTCSLKSQDRTWNCRMNWLDLKEYWMRNSSKQANCGMRAMPRAIKSLILDLKLQSLRETLTLSNHRELTCSGRSKD